MKRIIILFIILSLHFLYAEPPAHHLGLEQVLLSSGDGASHVAFPHTATDGQGNLYLVYRRAGMHAGSTGTLHLARYRLSDMTLLFHREIYAAPRLDPRDPTVTFREGTLFVSFFLYNYTFNMVRQFVLRLSSDTGGFISAPEMLENHSILNQASSSPMIFHGGRWILPLYYVNDFSSPSTDVGFFTFSNPRGRMEAELSTIAVGSEFDSFFLEPALAIRGDHWISLFRTSPVANGPGGLAPMLMNESFDGGETWSSPRNTPFLAHHPRMTVDSQGRIWAGFRDLSEYNSRTFKAKITLWQIPEELQEDSSGTETAITIYETSTPDSANWDCGYPSLIQLDDESFRVVYYYMQNGEFHIATRVLTLK